MKAQTINQIWAFGSSSGGNVYQTIRWESGAVSCDCPGWTRRVAPDGSRSCKHTRMVDLGLADQACLATNPPESIKKLTQFYPEQAFAKKIKAKKEPEAPSPAARGMTLEDE